jgi:hypothetical protein
VIDPIGSSDLFYQINRPRDSRGKIPDLIINRLSKWSILALQIAAIDSRGSMVKGNKRLSCRLELDISTSGEYCGTIDRKAIAPVFKELVELGKEISEKGDIP